MRKRNRIITIIAFVFFTIMTLISASIVASSSNAAAIETAAAFIKKGSRLECTYTDFKGKYIEFPESGEEMSKYANQYISSYTYYYYESTHSEDTTPIEINGHKAKILLNEYANDDVFGVELVAGTYPDSNSFIVSEDIAKYFGIVNASFPTSITFHQKNIGVEKDQTIQVSGIYKCENNKYINKPDFSGADASKYTIIGHSYKNKPLFGEFITVTEFLTEDKIHNAFYVYDAFQRMAYIASIRCFDDFTYNTYNERYSMAITAGRAKTIDPVLELNANNIFIPVLIISAIWFAVLGYMVIDGTKTNEKVYKTIYAFTFLGEIIAAFLLVLIQSILIKGQVLHLITIKSSLYFIFSLVLTFILMLSIDIYVEGRKVNKLANQRYREICLNNSRMVSIIIPTYNGSQYLQSAIESALMQSYRNIEIIVVDDGTDDDGKTEAIIDIFKDRITYYKKENGGVSSALNYGISKAKGYYINWLSHDDLLTPDSIERRLKFMSILENTNKVVIASNIKYVNSSGKKIFRFTRKSKDMNKPLDLMNSVAYACSFLVERSAFENHKFVEGMVYMPDHYMWAELMEDGYSFRCTSAITAYSRIHSGQITQKQSGLYEKDFNVFFDKYFRKYLNDNDARFMVKLLISLKKKEKLYPFYNKFISEIETALRSINKYTIEVKIKVKFSSLIGSLTAFIRKLKH